MLLKQVAEKIKGYLREVDTVARIGGDEFIIIQPQIKDINDATRAADRILKKFQQPWILEGKEYYITASMGIGIYPNDGEDPQTILKMRIRHYTEPKSWEGIIISYIPSR